MLLFRRQNAGQAHNVKVTNISSENVGKLIYFGTAPTNHSCIYEEITNILN
jgi:hypothetical protein